ncbi:MAG TPA: TetR/AcrR family transcriptional regulator [Caldilineae bacterium]|nr:TetR/AcrR family transcriptional regulator [Caldilineae bacterium]
MTSATAKKEERMAARREQILQAAIACFSRKGYHLTTMDDIVAESGMSKGSLYWHYKSKKDILISVAEWYFSQMMGEMMGMAQQAPTATDQIKMLLAFVVEMMGAEDALLNVFFDFYAETRHDDEVTDAVREVMMPFIDAIADIVAEGVASGEFRPVDARTVAVTFMAAGDGLFLYRAILTEQFDWRGVAEFFSEMFLASLAPEPGREPQP